MFGERSGAIMTAILYLYPGIERLVRGAILQSGSPNSIPAFRASRNEPSWRTFVGKVESCTSIANSTSTLPCLRNASTEEISAAAAQSVVLEDLAANLAWTPALDSSRGSVYPDLPSRLYSQGRFARLPFIAGTNLAEGTILARQDSLTDRALKDTLFATSSSRSGSENAWNKALDQLLVQYPQNPAVGSPYGTGDELSASLPRSRGMPPSVMGDLVFDAPRRLWTNAAAAKAGVKVNGYQYTHPQTDAPALGVNHGANLPLALGLVPPTADEATRNLSTAIMDYYISFAVSLNPNDGKGIQRPNWPQYTSPNKVLLQLNGSNTTVIPDSYRMGQIAFLNENAAVLNH